MLMGAVGGARVPKKYSERSSTKLIADVPILNYDAAYAGELLGEADAEGEWVVMANPGVSDEQIKQMCAAATQGCKLTGTPSKGGVPFFELRGTEKDLEAIVKVGGGAVKFVEPDGVVTMIPELESEISVASLWGLTRVGASTRANEGDGVTVFVLDTGVRVTHQDFGGRGIPTLDMTGGSPVECRGSTSCAQDNQGHGTHCAGTAAGGSYGVAPGATVRSVKVLGDTGSGSWSWSIGGLDWIASSSIRPAIASMSLGGTGTL